MNKKKLFSVLAVSALIAGGASTVAFANEDNTIQRSGQRDNEAHKIKHEAVKTAVENNDFEAFQTAVADSNFGQNITQENFSRLQDLHAAMESGDKETAKQIREELGLPDKKMKRGHKGKHKRNPESEAVRQAIDSADFNAFSEAISEDSPLASIDTQDEFTLLVQAKELKKSGDHEGAKEIMAQLGISHPKRK